jgi:hypothetical protein
MLRRRVFILLCFVVLFSITIVSLIITKYKPFIVESKRVVEMLGFESDRPAPNPNIPPVPSKVLSNGATERAALFFGESDPVRDLVATNQPSSNELRQAGGESGNEKERTIPYLERAGVIDPALQKGTSNGWNAPNVMPTPITNFDGVINLDSVYPPDTVGDVGPNHFVQMVNSHFQIFDKNGVSLYGPFPLSNLFSGMGAPCQSNNSGDPIVLYDSIADRWLLSEFTASSPWGECIAISTTPDPAGTYYRYFFQFSTTVFYDYPKLGVWSDGYYLTENRFTGSVYSGASAIALERLAMLTGTTARSLEFQTGTTYGPMLPADLDGPILPLGGAAEYFIELGVTDLHYWRYHIDWSNTANSSFTGPTAIAIAPYNELCPMRRNCIPQPGTTVGLDGIGDRLMHRLVYRNFNDHESLLVSHSVDLNASSPVRAGVRWYELRAVNAGALSIFQQGTFSPDTTNRWLPSVAMDQSGNIALGYSAGSSSQSAGVYATARNAPDPAGQMTLGELTIMTGTGAQTGPANRWGDYASMSVDPADDCTFWFTSEYVGSTGAANWRTRISSFRLPTCTHSLSTPTPTVVPSPTATSTASPSPTATPTPTPTATPTPTPTGTPTNRHAYLPIMDRNYPIMGINGKVTINGAPGANIRVGLLITTNGSPWQLHTSTRTDSLGIYRLNNAASLQVNQKYAAYFDNYTDPTFAVFCGGKSFSTYTAGTDVFGGDFEIANIPQLLPANGQTISLPFTFSWAPRAGLPSDNYGFEIWDKNGSALWDTGPNGLGYINQYTLSGIPAGFSAGKVYYWDVIAFGKNGERCYSYDQNRTVIFAP